MTSAANPDSLALPAGSRVDSLRVDRVLGQGAFGITYLVTDTVLAASFALKEYLPQALVRRDDSGRVVPLDESASALFARGLHQFLSEGRTVAGLAHPQIVKVYRCFEANGTAYLLMSYYHGEALHKLLGRGGSFSQAEALALARPVLDALEYLHGKDVVHQDIKPANIYITEAGDPVLLDFGAAGQRLQADSETRWQLGSEGYAAIEQSDPGGDIGPWTDIYGFAATLYRCVTGQVPVAASQRRSALLQGEKDPLEPVERLLPRSTFGEISGAISSGLALKTADRPRSIAEWRRQFSGFAPSMEREGREWLPLSLLGLFAVALLTALVWLFTDFGRAPSDESAPAANAPAQQGVTSAAQSPEELRRWQTALEADTAFGYRQFTEDFPDSIHNDQALVHLERLDHQAWGGAQAEGSKAAVEAYLAEFPEGLHRAEAAIRLEEFRLAAEAEQRALDELARQEASAWEVARAQRSIAALDTFLQAWPGGAHAAEARSLRAEIESQLGDRRAFEAASKLNTVEAYRSYFAAFPRGASVAAALEAIDRLTLRPGKTFRDCEDCPTMVVVPAGSFWQGSEESAEVPRNETPRRLVTFTAPFAASIFEITFAQWDACVAAGGCSTRPADNGWGRDARPVIMVSWNDAVEYTTWLSSKSGQAYSLPSESQWEYVARAGEESDWLGGDPAGICGFANIAGSESGLRWADPDCADPAALETLPVGSLQANDFGLYDVIGNVAEWTLDCMNLSYLDAPADGSAWGRGICSSRMTRGGSWFTGTREIRLPSRFNLKNGDRNDFTGFRVVRKVDSP